MQTLTVYLFDAASGEYRGAYEAQESPLEQGVFIAPTHSTPEAPPAIAANEAAVRADNAWIVQADHRGATVYHQTSGEQREMTALGALPDGYALTPPPPSLGQARAAQIAGLSAACAEAIMSGVQSAVLGAAHTYPAQHVDQANLVAAVTASHAPNLPADWTVNFWCRDAGGAWRFAPHTASQIQQVLADGVAQREACSAKLASLSSEVAAAQSIAAIEAITW